MDAVGQLTSALAGRYTVDKEIRRGGMATVYLARDGTILAFQPPGGSTQFIVVRNLAAELRARVQSAPR